MKTHFMRRILWRNANNNNNDDHVSTNIEHMYIYTCYMRFSAHSNSNDYEEEVNNNNKNKKYADLHRSNGKCCPAYGNEICPLKSIGKQAI